MGFDDEGKVVMVEQNIEDDEDDDLELHKPVRYSIPIIFRDKFLLCNVHGRNKNNFHNSFSNNEDRSVIMNMECPNSAIMKI